MNSLYIIISLFALGAIVGMYLLSLVIQKKETPKIGVLIHGAFVSIALVLLVIYNSQCPGFTEAIILFVVAILGGVVLFFRDITNKPMPRWLAIGHGMIAALGFVVLLVKAFT